MKLSRVISVMFILLFWIPIKSFALSCLVDGSSSASFNEALGTDLAVQADAPNGTIIWESQSRSVPVICADNREVGRESIYFYLNPASVSVGQGIRVGIRYKGIAITQSSGKYDTGHHSQEGCNWVNCTGWRSAKFTLNFSVFIEKYGTTPTTGQATSLTSYRVFQLDGVGGLNPTPNSNLNYVLTGLNKIRFVPCSPKLTVTPSTIDFGRLSSGGGQSGQQITASRFSLNLKRDCTTPYTVNARFTPKTGSILNGLLVPANNSSVGISLFRAESNEKLAYNSWFKLTDMTGTTPARIDLFAQLLWRAKPVIGPFDAAVVIDLFYK
ncbi:fimbrial protein [Pseudomonas chlororaphis]|uniref:fimbrial protein n=1 Tax=Pseudomonas chlororaphis TaxID=587753 RepID=UPI0024087AD0|nr:fimbrial protein [Pseudomonas chlororaphis]